MITGNEKMGRKKNKNSDKDELVYTTAPSGNAFFDNIFLSGADESDENTESDYTGMRIRVSRDRKQRGGKEVTLVKGLELEDEDLEALGKKLKSSCGVGGSVKDGIIMIQGNKIARVIELLKKEGYKDVKQHGG